MSECTIINCHADATGTAATIGLPPADVCERCGVHFYGNFTPYPTVPLFDLEAVRG